MANVLVVDDMEYCRHIIAKILTEAGHTIVGEADNGADAVRKYKELRPDVTTMDITMPVMDGLEALREIMEFDSEAKVVMISTSGQDSVISEAFALGAIEFVSKESDYLNIAEIVTDRAAGFV
jgi:two-component system chemotaxis response regulator CheY